MRVPLFYSLSKESVLEITRIISNFFYSDDLNIRC